MPTVNLTLEQLLEALRQLTPDEMKQVERKLRQGFPGESEEDARRALVAAAVETTDWWDQEGDKEWDKWQP
jgi:hypothetical protein